MSAALQQAPGLDAVSRRGGPCLSRLPFVSVHRRGNTAHSDRHYERSDHGSVALWCFSSRGPRLTDISQPGLTLIVRFAFSFCPLMLDRDDWAID